MGKQRPLRFGAGTRTVTSRQEWIDTVRWMEDVGYSTVMAPDHFIADYAPIAALATAAAVTQTLRIAGYVFCNDFRHPTVLAKEAATLDVMSEGRLELGLGAGWLDVDFQMPGIPFDPPATRIQRLGEAVRI